MAKWILHLVVWCSVVVRTLTAPDTSGTFPRGKAEILGPEANKDPYIDIFPPKWYPGDVLKKTGQRDIDKALDDVMRAGDILQDRRCALGLANEAGARLTNPRYAFSSGQTHSSPPFDIQPGQTGLNLFLKFNGIMGGTYGVITYDIAGTNYMVAVMWSVPYDFGSYDIWYNVKIYPTSTPTDTDLAYQMYYVTQPWKPAGYDTRTEKGVKIRSIMTDNRLAKLIVWVDTTEFDGSIPTDLSTYCSYHTAWVGSYCNQECYPTGWCWVNRRCSGHQDCQGPLTCHTGC